MRKIKDCVIQIKQGTQQPTRTDNDTFTNENKSISNFMEEEDLLFSD